jgi:hypothetical protein
MLDLLVDRMLAQDRLLLLGIYAAVEVEALVSGLLLQLKLRVREAGVALHYLREVLGDQGIVDVWLQ